MTESDIYDLSQEYDLSDEDIEFLNEELDKSKSRKTDYTVHPTYIVSGGFSAGTPELHVYKVRTKINQFSGGIRSSKSNSYYRDPKSGRTFNYRRSSDSVKTTKAKRGG
jgi:hypothetical protein